jgi:dTDP-4-dehydrorhamnose reductase
MKIAITGACGQLGQAIVKECLGHHEVTALSHLDLDIEDERVVAKRIEAVQPDAVVNCAAYNDVDGAEDNVLKALALNAFAVRHLSRAAEQVGASFVHFGSDFVFDGTAATPYSEDDRPNPLSVYGASKLLGEQLAETQAAWYVLRVESLFGEVRGVRPKGTIAAMRARLIGGEALRVFEDRVASPSYVFDVVRAIRFLLEHPSPSGVYHCVNSGFCTWVEFAHELANQLHVAPKLEVIKTSDVRLRAARPRYCALSNDKLSLAGLTMPAWRDAVRRYANMEQPCMLAL